MKFGKVVQPTVIVTLSVVYTGRLAGTTKCEQQKSTLNVKLGSFCEKITKCENIRFAKCIKHFDY